MAKFKKGDRVECIGSYRGGGTYAPYNVGDVLILTEDCDEAPDAVHLDGRETCILARDMKSATPTEHPALTLAKAEVVRLMSQEVFETLGGYSHGRLGAMQEVLSAFGLRYSPKPVVPQPVEYEFVSIEPEQGA